MLDLQIIGPGCSNCEELTERTREAADTLELDYEIEKVTELDEFADYGVMMTPALAVGGTAVVSGDVPDVDHIEEILKENTET